MESYLLLLFILVFFSGLNCSLLLVVLFKVDDILKQLVESDATNDDDSGSTDIS